MLLANQCSEKFELLQVRGGFCSYRAACLADLQSHETTTTTRSIFLSNFTA